MSPSIPAELLYPEPTPGTAEVRQRALDGVVAILQTGTFAGACAEACVLFDAVTAGLQDPPVLLTTIVGPIRRRSLIHRWIVRDAIWCARAIAIAERVPVRPVTHRERSRYQSGGWPSFRIEFEPVLPSPEEARWLHSARKLEVEVLRAAEAWVRLPTRANARACARAATGVHALDPNDDNLLAVGRALGAAHAVLSAVAVLHADAAADAVGIAAYLVAHGAAYPEAQEEAEEEADRTATDAWAEARGCPEERTTSEVIIEELEEAGDDAYEEVYLDTHFRALRDGLENRARTARAEARRRALLRFSVLAAIQHLLPVPG